MLLFIFLQASMALSNKLLIRLVEKAKQGVKDEFGGPYFAAAGMGAKK